MMSARKRPATLLTILALTLWGVGLVPFLIDRASPMAAAKPPCITLPDAVPSWAAAPRKNPRVCSPVAPYTLRTTDEPTADPVWKTSYSADTTYDVFFALDVSGDVTGAHSYTLFIFAPGVIPYQAIDVTYTSTSCTPVFGSACWVDQTSDGIRVWTSFPVAGTIIEQFSLFGTWTADAYIDAAVSPTATTAFDIGP
jgi:hypothetical protein